ncbi:unnamed protein product [Clonostachys solani]|uniref:Aminoglycoside phosphotransferase domain-containing protein n=1 Tax=Clonostachys solani TaxID=160281 RepID=A0A9N9W4K6_9HYPO|nr:unnamed protein product [Clonostachys solani]
MSSSEMSGLKWVATLWGLEPRWTTNLDENAIQKTAQLALQRPCPDSIQFLAKGIFNKLYSVGTNNSEAVIRITMPILSELKTESEVATMHWVQRHTSLPVPNILAYESHCKNEIGFEWICMEKVKGKTLGDAWWELDFAAKERVIRQIAQFYSDTFSHQMKTIGSLYEHPSSEGQTTHIGKSTSLAFLVRGPQSEVQRGPFTSCRDWITAQLNAAEADCKHRLEVARAAEIASATKEQSVDEEKQEEGEDPEDLETSLTIITKLRGQIASFFPETSPEPTVLMHHDLNKHNILVNADGSLSGVVDWEWISTYPLSMACQYPGFIDGKDRSTKPVKSTYHHDDNGKVNELYWEHLEFYELHQLRILFMDTMRALQPRWVEVFNKSQRQRDFYIAIWTYDNPLNMKRLLKWLSDLESGIPDVMGLEERINNNTL